jgi:hypothetical protein
MSKCHENHSFKMILLSFHAIFFRSFWLFQMEMKYKGYSFLMRMFEVSVLSWFVQCG